MLELRPNCECCDAALPPDAPARICTYECTFCPACADGCFGGWCPNCGGNLTPRPVRPARLLPQDPPSAQRVTADHQHGTAVRTMRCPVCGTPRQTLARYPRALCDACVARATDAAGVAVRLSNTSGFGGFVALCADALSPDGSEHAEVTRTQLVFVDGIECRAAEARFGGIVVQPTASPGGASAHSET